MKPSFQAPQEELNEGTVEKRNEGITGHTINFSGVYLHVYIVKYQHVESIECHELYEFNLSSISLGDVSHFLRFLGQKLEEMIQFDEHIALIGWRVPTNWKRTSSAQHVCSRSLQIQANCAL